MDNYLCVLILEQVLYKKKRSQEFDFLGAFFLFTIMQLFYSLLKYPTYRQISPALVMPSITIE